MMDAADQALAERHAPRLMLDSAEPYWPYALGYTVFRTEGPSPSCRFTVSPMGAMAIEYAVYYDWDIGHLYDLEHIWVHLDAQGAVVAVEASAHGGRRSMDIGQGLPEMREGRPVVYVEAGKHAHWAAPEHMAQAERDRLGVLCGAAAGIEGVALANARLGRQGFAAGDKDARLARLKMQGDAFVPSHDYVEPEQAPRLLAWPALEVLMPGRLRAELDRLERDVPHLGAIFLDCGDTLVDERSEVKLPGSEVVVDGKLIPGAGDMVRALKAVGHRLVLVADGPRQTFVNLLGKHGLWDQFDAHIISEDVGVHKPDARMFDAALAAAGLTRADAWRCVMVGNNLSRDIKGAKALGIPSVFMAWSTLRTHVPADASEVPDYRIATPFELVGLVAQLERLLAHSGHRRMTDDGAPEPRS